MGSFHDYDLLAFKLILIELVVGAHIFHLMLAMLSEARPVGNLKKQEQTETEMLTGRIHSESA